MIIIHRTTLADHQLSAGMSGDVTFVSCLHSRI